MQDEILEIRYDKLEESKKRCISVLSTMNKEKSVDSGYTKTSTIEFTKKLAGYIL